MININQLYVHLASNLTNKSCSTLYVYYDLMLSDEDQDVVTIDRYIFTFELIIVLLYNMSVEPKTMG